MLLNVVQKTGIGSVRFHLQVSQTYKQQRASQTFRLVDDLVDTK